jgi:hypothetical protein
MHMEDYMAVQGCDFCKVWHAAALLQGIAQGAPAAALLVM